MAEITTTVTTTETPVPATTEVVTPVVPAVVEPPREQTVPLSRLQAVIAQKAESERAKEALQRELKLATDTLAEHQALSKRQQTTDGTQTATTVTTRSEKALSPAEIQALVSEEAAKQNFNERCNATATEGRAAHADFDKVVLGDLTSVSPAVGQNGRPMLGSACWRAALETGQAHEVLYALGQDINEASRIMGLRPTAQAVALAKFADKLATKVAETTTEELDDDGAVVDPKVSKAPPPIKTAVSRGSVKPAWKAEDTDNFSTEQWIRNP